LIWMGFYELAEKAMELERQGKKVIRLNIGDTNLPTPDAVVEAARGSLKASKAKYGPAAGLMELRERIAEREGCPVGNVIVGPSSKYMLFALLSVLCKAGDKVVLPTPTWPAYGMVCKQLGLEARMVGSRMEEGWDFGSLPLEGAKACIICDPLNPTSTTYKKESVEAAIDQARRTGTQIILDEAYRDLSFEPQPRYEGAIRVRSFSKEFNMEGWRVGYAIVHPEIAAKLVSFIQITATCVAPFVQAGAVAALEHRDGIIKANMDVWRPRMERTGELLSKAGFRFARPQAGIYFFLTHEGIKDSYEYALKLLDQGVAVSPGKDFGGYDQFIRICANQSQEKLAEAVELMAEAL